MISSNRTKTMDMTSGAIISQIVSFAVPLFLGNIFQQLYNTADCFIVGHFLGRDALAAVGSTSHLVLIAIGFFNGLSTGAQVIISQSFGARDTKTLNAAINTSLLFSFITGIVLSFVGFFASPLILKLISVPPSIFKLASSYLRIYFSGISFLILYNMASGILRALGDSKRPLYFLIFSSFVNIILDLLFIIILKMGIKGAALATVFSQMISVIPAFVILFAGINVATKSENQEVFRFSLKNLKINISILKKMLKIGLPGAVSSSVTSFSNTFMQKYVNIYGASCIAGWAVFARFDGFIIMPMISISFAVTTFVSQNYGARQSARIKNGIQLSYLLNVFIIGFLSVLLFVFAQFLSSFFTDDTESIRYASLFIRYTAPFYLLCSTTMFFSQALRGFGDSLVPTIITFSGFVVLRQAFLFITTRLSDSFAAVAVGYPIVWCVTSLVMFLYYRWKIKNKFNQL